MPKYAYGTAASDQEIVRRDLANQHRQQNVNDILAGAGALFNTLGAVHRFQQNRADENLSAQLAMKIMASPQGIETPMPPGVEGPGLPTPWSVPIGQQLQRQQQQQNSGDMLETLGNWFHPQGKLTASSAMQLAQLGPSIAHQQLEQQYTGPMLAADLALKKAQTQEALQHGSYWAGGGAGGRNRSLTDDQLKKAYFGAKENVIKYSQGMDTAAAIESGKVLDLGDPKYTAYQALMSDPKLKGMNSAGIGQIRDTEQIKLNDYAQQMQDRGFSTEAAATQNPLAAQLAQHPEVAHQGSFLEKVLADPELSKTPTGQAIMKFKQATFPNQDLSKVQLSDQDALNFNLQQQ